MLAGLPDHEKEAFFQLLDGYFESRPHLLPGGGQAHVAGSPGLSAAANNGSGAGSITVNRDDLDRAGRFAATPVGQKVAGFAAGRMMGNKALGNAAASAWAGHHQSTQGSVSPSGSSAALPLPARRGPPPAAPSSATKPQGIAGLVSGKTFGGLNIGPKTAPGSAMPPRKLSSPRIPTTTASPASGAGRLPPPARTGPAVMPSASTGSASPAPAAAPQASGTPEVDGLGYAEALYDYGDASDPDDLVVVEGERIVLLEKISDDWWRARKESGGQEAGIVPTAYVRQL
ncbi:uncharacterized protein PFL1_06662 [Pseudozyma flocculosa PF-1]|uniref:SH3 domain-containing protein n=1 Tax=Pseudozyma flocculosa PF-1 TaxID=1277687 RepID=A0A061H1Y5_9BASI|nr:uncharacterized protein PFL1_06662 [Pseudozyma flocculosa PF-1]EPQ25795.1 hypothetical protein PFL1_06662 [Pseudozyma flocculosa PF-1]